MGVVARELPIAGYAIEVDGRLKIEFESREGAVAGAEELKTRFPVLQVKIYDAPGRKFILGEARSILRWPLK